MLDACFHPTRPPIHNNLSQSTWVDGYSTRRALLIDQGLGGIDDTLDDSDVDDQLRGRLPPRCRVRMSSPQPNPSAIRVRQ